MTRSAWKFAVVLAVLALAAGVAFVRAESSAPSVSAPEALFLGRNPRSLDVDAADEGSGLRSVEVILSHARGESPLLDRRLPGDLLRGGGPAAERVEIHLDPKALDVAEGDAFLNVIVRDWSWRGRLRGNATRIQIPVTIDLQAPRLAVQSGLTYVRRGGAGLVVYRIGEDAARDGVAVAESFYPGVDGAAACGPGAGSCRMALFAVPVDAPANPPIRVVAEDRAGNATSSRWATRLQELQTLEVPIELSDGFLEGKVRELADAWRIDAADAVAAFQDINSRVRARDEARIRELAGGAGADKPLWTGPFEQLADTKVTSLFAERRLYRRDGQVVSQATHYGYDLASTAGAPVTASNAGRVIFAGDLGIYGDAVLIDHGLGVTSLYGHLSSVEVRPGDAVEKGAVLGRSGQTGLAGGDHLHFAILVGGTYVDPREWWDPKWLREHVEAPMAP